MLRVLSWASIFLDALLQRPRIGGRLARCFIRVVAEPPVPGRQRRQLAAQQIAFVLQIAALAMRLRDATERKGEQVVEGAALQQPPRVVLHGRSDRPCGAC